MEQGVEGVALLQLALNGHPLLIALFANHSLPVLELFCLALGQPIEALAVKVKWRPVAKLVIAGDTLLTPTVSRVGGDPRL